MTSEQVERLADHLDIENFRKNASVNFNVVKEAGLTNSGEADFIRKGFLIKILSSLLILKSDKQFCNRKSWRLARRV